LRKTRASLCGFFCFTRFKFFEREWKSDINKWGSSGAGYPLGKNNLDLIDQAALIRTLRQSPSVRAVPAGALYQVADFKIKPISFDGHVFLSFLFFLK